jgi:hypothetical protein
VGPETAIRDATVHTSPSFADLVEGGGIVGAGGREPPSGCVVVCLTGWAVVPYVLPAAAWAHVVAR